MKKIEIMKPLDEFIADKVDGLNSIPEFQKLSEAYSNLEESMQEIIKTVLMIATILIPLSIIFIFSSLNSGSREELNLKEEIINTANDLIQSQALVNLEERKILSTRFIDAQNLLKDQITNALAALSIDSAKVQINNFDSEEQDGLITKIKADLAFRGFSDQQVFAMTESLVSKQKIRIDEINISKKESSNSLDGVLTIHYYSKDTVVE